MPELGSSRNTTMGCPTSARPSESFLLFPPLNDPATMPRYLMRSTRLNSRSTSSATCVSGMPRNLAKHLQMLFTGHQNREAGRLEDNSPSILELHPNPFLHRGHTQQHTQQLLQGRL
eukprot:GABV01004358.1.p1 GENE.GABV01004358.1~~GABV01004358.1.p1  ORF type:complete len:124 (+),score=15.31 GABV01004358.1:23-373(+)